tara:strand:- start:2596 stop:3864 length:1269 start_codon:yes stop_codon:yes gene_type:complete
MPLDPRFKKHWFESIGYEPHSKGQWDVHMSEARFRVIVCGRRWGKSYSISQEVTAYLGKEGAQICVIGPTYNHADIVFNEVVRRVVQEQAYPTKRVTNYEIETTWGSRVLKKSADKPESILGRGYDLVVVDEFSVLKEDIWTQYIRPTLTDRQGDALLIGTPRGFNYAYHLYRNALTDPEWASFRNPTWTNPLIAKEEIEVAKQQLPELLFRQEYGAEFVAVGGMVYPYQPDVHIDNRFVPHTQYTRVIGGVDWGFANPSAVLLGGVTCEKPLTIHIFHEWAQARQTTPEVVKKLKELQDKYGVVEFFVDPSAADLIEQAASAGVRTAKANNDIPAGLAATTALMEQNPPRLTFTGGLSQTTYEITHYRYEDTLSGSVKERPEKRDDHCMDAMRYLIMGARDSYQPFEGITLGNRFDLSVLE